MTALSTASEVLEWSLSPSGVLPQGDLTKATTLADPNDKVIRLMGQLCAQIIARWQWGTPPLGDNRPFSHSTVLLAAALGNMHTPKLAEALINTLPVANSVADWLLKYSLIINASTYLPESVYASCLRMSPLTALLGQPNLEQNSQVLSIIDKIRSEAKGRRWLALQWAQPVSNNEQRNWRSDVLLRLRRTEQADNIDFVLDVYEAQMIHFRQVLFSQLDESRKILLDPIAHANHQALQTALSIVNWWQALWEIRRSGNDAIRQRLYLDYQYLDALKLYQMARQLTGQGL